MTHTLETLAKLEALLEERKSADPEKSYVARLYHKGDKKIAQKVGEEAVETAMAVAASDNGELVAESADLLFHLMVLLHARGLSLGDVAVELARREGLSGLEEKASRTP
ncbi:phosphoribosyl-ATP diphosphatase [Kordiimonas gwangyangensis]|uniref:phosphoribosyl-ATP diphosphatase n=1 Tax=Kordiimonas gwangyangensis TaxID=288022 RepID=UPI000365EE41|nr:phosphoribosyl-ATP diphosphatase [Kordiimonas gwangyangensis]